MRETIYLVPGLLCDSTVWEHQHTVLAADYDVIVPDLTRQCSIGQMAIDILADAPARFSIAGHSMGARVALAVVDQAPERVDRIALLDTGVHPATTDEPVRRQELLDISARSGMRALADRWLPPMVKDGTLDADPSLREKLYAMVERMSPQIHRNQIGALLGRPDARTQLGAIACPVLIGVGEQDRWSPPEQHEAIAAAIPHARYVVFPDSGHMAPMEAPTAVTEALQYWLRAQLQA
ncbi:alpha/beta hydrolase [Sphingobium sp. AN641]|uniref:alpha/beta fold hydrolase n=1 Tax=Sphingobium sp. AN641 TaxID=3133443 RepID=UPI0030C0D9B1